MNSFISKMNKRLSTVEVKRPYLPMIFSVVYQIVIVALCPRYFASNDNRAIIEDILANAPTTVMSPLLGKIISLAHVYLSNETSWFGLFIYACLIGSHLLVTWVVFRLPVPNFLRMIIFAVTLIIHTRFLMVTGYNAASILVAGASVGAFLYGLISDQSIKRREVLLLGSAFALAYLIRSKGVIGCGVFFAPTVLLYMYHQRFRFTKLWVLFFTPLVLVFISNAAYVQFGTSDSYKDYRKWNSVRGKFHAYPISVIQESNSAVLEKNNWTMFDYSSVKKFIFYDENLYNETTVRNVLETDIDPVRAEVIKSEWINNSLKKHQWPLYFNIGQMVISIIAMIFVLKPSKLYALIPLYVIYFFSVALLMTWFLRFPDRVGLPFTYIGFLNILALVGLCSVQRSHVKNFFKVFCFFMLVLCSMGGQKLTYVLIEDAYSSQMERSQIDIIYDKLKANEYSVEYAYLLPGDAGIKKQYMDPLKVYRYGFFVLPAGWSTYSERFYTILNEVGLNHGYELMPSMVENKEAVVIGREYYAVYTVMYLKNIHGIECRLEEIQSLPGGVGVFNIVEGALNEEEGVNNPL